MKKNMKKIIALVLTTAAVGTSSMMIFAQGNTTGANNTKAQKTESVGRAPQKGLDDLVSNGTISQETADKITTYMKAKDDARKVEMDKVKSMTQEERKAFFEENKPTKENPMDTMVTDGIITQAEADAIQANMPQRAEREDKGADHRGGGLNTEALVSQGIVSQSTADKMTKFLEAHKEERKAEMENVKNMTPEERKAYFEANKETRENIFDTMVTEGVLTQAEADAIQANMPAKPDREANGFDKNRKGGVRDFNKYVTEGIISQETADKAAAFMETQKEQWQAEKEKMDSMTQEERQAYLQEKKDNKTDMLDTLVSNGILTQEEANNIKATHVSVQ